MMKIILSAAISLDGFLDDCSPRRLRLSSDEDWSAVACLRAECDAILVGAGTVRKDNPALVVKDHALVARRESSGMSPQPAKIVVSASGDLDPSSRFFTEGVGEKIVVTDEASKESVASRLGGCARVLAVETLTARSIARALAREGIGRLMVEGGSRVLTMFLSEGIVDEFRLAMAPFFVGQADAPRLVLPADFVFDTGSRLIPVNTELLGDTTVITFKNGNGPGF